MVCLKYYIPANKIVIECTRDMWLRFEEVIYEEDGDLQLKGYSSFGDPYCFVVITSSWRKRFGDYDQAYELYKVNKLYLEQENQKMKNDIYFHGGKFIQ